MGYNSIKTEIQDRIAVLTLNRPTRLNSISRELGSEMADFLAKLPNEDVNVLIVTGAARADGRPCFSAGADLKEMAEIGPMPLPRPDLIGAIEGLAALDPTEGTIQTLFDQLESLPLFTIAAIDGVCTAGGIEIALCCDVRLVAETAQVSDMHLKNLGRPGGGGVTARLTRAVGPGWAKLMLCTCEPMDPQILSRIGFAQGVYAPDQLLTEARKLAAKVAGMSKNGVRLTKATVDATTDMTRKEALRFSYLCWAAGGGSSNTTGAQAFSEKRAADFSKSGV
ncbi:MAG: enoyl-CoA hydratase/isomerase family protein [Chloroflexi bacterium]|nr:enoyl-CoA hydratase/isomerase family protein [Chloroflexota bacterium]